MSVPPFRIFHTIPATSTMMYSIAHRVIVILHPGDTTKPLLKAIKSGKNWSAGNQLDSAEWLEDFLHSRWQGYFLRWVASLNGLQEPINETLPASPSRVTRRGLSINCVRNKSRRGGREKRALVFHASLATAFPRFLFRYAPVQVDATVYVRRRAVNDQGIPTE